MDPEPKRTGKEMMVDDNEDGDELEEFRSKRRPVVVVVVTNSPSADSNSLMPATARKVAGATVSVVVCQAEKCSADLSEAKKYHRRHKVCEAHSKAPAVFVAGISQRFCQQCSRFHELSEFDEAKRSCHRRLAGHNERRRKSSSESQGEGSSGCRQADQGRGTMKISLGESPTYKHFQIR